jgi:hypothetical protein
MADGKTELPPRDSWLSVAPGQELNIDAELLQKWNKQTRKYRELRGNILAACFGLEYSLDMALAEVFFPGLDPRTGNSQDSAVSIDEENAKALKGLFDELFLKSGSLPFKFKIDLLRRLTGRIGMLQASIPPDLLKNLDAVRDVRNRFAHYPVTFEPTGSVLNEELNAKLVCRDKTLILDQSFLDATSALFRVVTKDLEEMLLRLRAESLGIQLCCPPHNAEPHNKALQRTARQHLEINS